MKILNRFAMLRIIGLVMLAFLFQSVTVNYIYVLFPVQAVKVFMLRNLIPQKRSGMSSGIVAG